MMRKLEGMVSESRLTSFRLVTVLIITFCQVMVSAQNRVSHLDAKQSLIIRHASLVNIKRGSIQKHMTVVVKGDTITQVASDSKVRNSRNNKTIDAKGKYLIPGLWDMHVHLSGFRESGLALLIANGVTGVRDMGGDLTYLSRIKGEIENEERIGPRIVLAGPLLDCPAQQDYPQVCTPEEARRVVSELKLKGVDFIKVYSLVPRDAYFVLLAEAKAQNLTVVGHVPVSVSATEASNGGQKSFEHLYGVLAASFDPEQHLTWRSPYITNRQLYSALGSFSKAKESELFDLFVRNHTWQVPTLIILFSFSDPEAASVSTADELKYVTKATVADWRKGLPFKKLPGDDEQAKKLFWKHVELVSDMHTVGVRILAGTDAGTQPYLIPGFSLHRELQWLVRAGLTPREALEAAASGPAEFLGKTQELGTIESGKKADMVLLNRNPLQNISNTQRIAAVITRGRPLLRDDLDRMLAAVISSAAKN